MKTIDAAWTAYQSAHQAYLAAPTAENARNAVDAYQRWCLLFVPDDAERLVADYRAKLAVRSAA